MVLEFSAVAQVLEVEHWKEANQWLTDGWALLGVYSFARPGSGLDGPAAFVRKGHTYVLGKAA